MVAQPVNSPALNVFAFFHLNLMFSSIGEERREEVIQNCYWPLLELPQRIGAAIGLEAPGLTLEMIAAIDPAWITALRTRINDKSIELIGSGYAQTIGPLLPAHVNRRNLALGSEVYEQLAGHKPALALINEQAYSGGLLPLYREAGYRAVLMDFDNVKAHHPEWAQDMRFNLQSAVAPDGSELPLIWTQTMAFQKLQRYAHGELDEEAYLNFIQSMKGPKDRLYCLYSNDAEIFDFRPKRLHTEEPLAASREWDRIAAAWAKLAATPGIRFVAPSQGLNHPSPEGAIRLETSGHPIPVKKQPKYNIARWAVAGRDNLAINAACHRLADSVAASRPHETRAWKSVCRLWSSDFRTHIGDARWAEFKNELSALAPPEPASDQVPAPSLRRATANVAPGERWLDIETDSLVVRLNCRRGLAIDSMRRKDDPAPPMLGSLLHGHFSDIALQADWYTGNLVFDLPGIPKVTDLEWATPALTHTDAAILIEAEIKTPLGPVHKRMTVHRKQPRIDWDITLNWHEWSRGSLRAAHFLVMPDAFKRQDLCFETHNGGDLAERFAVNGRTINHGAPVSFLVSASAGLGMTEGWLKIGDGKRAFTILCDRSVSPMLGLVEHQETEESTFFRVQLSALEMDDTRKPEPGPVRPRRIKYSVELG